LPIGSRNFAPNALTTMYTSRAQRDRFEIDLPRLDLGQIEDIVESEVRPLRLHIAMTMALFAVRLAVASAGSGRRGPQAPLM